MSAKISYVIQRKRNNRWRDEVTFPHSTEADMRTFFVAERFTGEVRLVERKTEERVLDTKKKEG